MIFVEFQYRVGLHGFLSSQEIKDNGNLNAGLLDQRAAFLWVQKYISKVRTLSASMGFVLSVVVWRRSFPSCHSGRFCWSCIRRPTSHFLRWQRSPIQRGQSTIRRCCRYISWLLRGNHCTSCRMAIRFDPSAYQLHNGKTGVLAWRRFQYSSSREYGDGVARR